jgi:hypothetical protein
MEVCLGRYCLCQSLLQSLLCVYEKSIEHDIVFVRPSDELQRALDEESATNYSAISRNFAQRTAAVRANNPNLVDVETIIRSLQGSWKPIRIQDIVVAKTEVAVHSCDSVEVTAGWENARVFIQIEFAVLSHHDQVHYARLGVSISTFLTEAYFWTRCTTDARTLMTALERVFTAL